MCMDLEQGEKNCIGSCSSTTRNPRVGRVRTNRYGTYERYQLVVHIILEQIYHIFLF
jgi:hypothetical protein